MNINIWPRAKGPCVRNGGPQAAPEVASIVVPQGPFEVYFSKGKRVPQGACSSQKT